MRRKNNAGITLTLKRNIFRLNGIFCIHNYGRKFVILMEGWTGASLYIDVLLLHDLMADTCRVVLIYFKRFIRTDNTLFERRLKAKVSCSMFVIGFNNKKHHYNSVHVPLPFSSGKMEREVYLYLGITVSKLG